MGMEVEEPLWRVTEPQRLKAWLTHKEPLDLKSHLSHFRVKAGAFGAIWVGHESHCPLLPSPQKPWPEMTDGGVQPLSPAFVGKVDWPSGRAVRSSFRLRRRFMANLVPGTTRTWNPQLLHSESLRTSDAVLWLFLPRIPRQQLRPRPALRGWLGLCSPPGCPSGGRKTSLGHRWEGASQVQQGNMLTTYS